MTLEHRPTIVDVTEPAGVSSRMVFRVLQRPETVSGATQLGRASASPSRNYG